MDAFGEGQKKTSLKSTNLFLGEHLHVLHTGSDSMWGPYRKRSSLLRHASFERTNKQSDNCVCSFFFLGIRNKD